MDSRRWWAGIIRAITSGLGLYGLFALLLTGFAVAILPSKLSEAAQLTVLAWTGVGGLLLIIGSFIILWRNPRHLADQVALQQSQIDAIKETLESPLFADKVLDIVRSEIGQEDQNDEHTL